MPHSWNPKYVTGYDPILRPLYKYAADYMERHDGPTTRRWCPMNLYR